MALVINLKADTGLVDRSENTTRFYRDVNQYKPLTQEEEVKWFRQMKYGTPQERKEAKEHIIKCNQRLVIAAAKNWASTDTLMDYTNAANIGLMRAIDKFDEERGVKFASFAMWHIKTAINEEVAEEQMIKRTNYSKTFHVIAKAKNKFIQEFERTPTSDELKEIVNKEYGKGIKDKADLLDVRMARIDVDIDDENSCAYSDITEYNTASASYNEYEAQSQQDFNKEVISTMMSKLTPREQEIINLRFGLNDEFNGECQIAEVAERLGVTKERIRQIEKEALAKMKKMYLERMSNLL
jgi:RNA polymerase primary sigma factor/RNA polymerase nonessential primary-like sigma factor